MKVNGQKLDINYADLNAPQVPPWVAREIYHMWRGEEISKRMLSHWVETTIEKSASPAEGRGTQQDFSFQDLTLMFSGLDFRDLDLPAKVVVQCVAALRAEWDMLIQTRRSDSKQNSLFLVAHRENKDFVIRLVSYQDFWTVFQTITGASIAYDATRQVSLHLRMTQMYLASWTNSVKRLTQALGPENLVLLKRLAKDYHGRYKDQLESMLQLIDN